MLQKFVNLTHMKNQTPEIRENQSIELLKELHILTRDGALNQDSRRKLKQVYHLYNFIEPLLNDLLLELKTQSEKKTFTVVDHGAGKSYLGFILYDLFFKQLSTGHIYGIEFREELIKKSKELSAKLKFDRMDFFHLTVEDSITTALLPAQIDMVTALHACNTATDDAIHFALKKKSKFIVLVPCCQAEIAQIFKKNKARDLKRTALTELWRHPIHTREFGSHLTNVLRALQLEAHGYQVTVTELVGFEHSMKNELIVAKKIEPKNSRAAEKLSSLLQEFGLEELSQRFFLP